MMLLIRYSMIKERITQGSAFQFSLSKIHN